MTIVFKVSNNIKDAMIKYYEDLKRPKTPPYAIFQAQEADTIITLYQSGKAMFQGISADIDARIWIDLEKKVNNRTIDLNWNEKKEKDKKDDKDIETYYHLSTIGSDEVGTGDYFGPIVVSAAFVDKAENEFLTELGVKDSKKLTDEKIIEIAPKLIKKIPHATFVLDNISYNKSYSADINMNKIKAILHNKALLSLANKEKYPYQRIIVDQFVYRNKYYEYLNEVPEKVTNIWFTTKAEDKCFSVAVASIISRYRFLQEMDKLSAKLGLTLPKGAGTIVDETGKKILQKFGEEKLIEIAKINFKNTAKIKKT